MIESLERSAQRWLRWRSAFAGAVLMATQLSACGLGSDERVDAMAACTGSNDPANPEEVVAAADPIQVDGDEVAACVLTAAGTASDGLPAEWADVVERIIVQRPLVLVQPHDAENWLLADLPLDPVGTQIDSDLVTNALEAVFQSGEGALLVALRDTLIPLHVDLWLETGADPGEIDTGYLGEIDGRISQARARTTVQRGATIKAPDDELSRSGHERGSRW